jgi:DNA polymerase I
MTYKALNRLIQGSAADQAKKAMVDCAKAGFLPLIQIHDELCFSVKNKEDAKQIKNIMENCVTMSVPSKVDVETGPSWGEIKPFSNA